MTIDEIANILMKAAESRPDLLAEGARRHEEIVQSLAVGLPSPYPYRTEWLSETAFKVIETISNEAEIFNDKHTDDQTSGQDIIDVLINALNLIVKSIGGEGVQIVGPTITLKFGKKT